jgi:hypothetical protein
MEDLKRSDNMKTWHGMIVMSYWNEITVEAETEEEAKDMMFKRFDISKADQGEGEVWDIKEIEGESK